MRYSTDKQVEKMVRELLARNCGWAVSHSGKHLKLVAPNGRKITVSRSPSDTHAYRNIMADIRRTERHHG